MKEFLTNELKVRMHLVQVYDYKGESTALPLASAIIERVPTHRLSTLGMTHVYMVSGLNSDFHTLMFLPFVIYRALMHTI